MRILSGESVKRPMGSHLLKSNELHKEEGCIMGGHVSNLGHLADKQRHRPPQGPVNPYRNLLNSVAVLAEISLGSPRKLFIFTIKTISI